MCEPITGWAVGVRALGDGADGVCGAGCGGGGGDQSSPRAQHPPTLMCDVM